MSKQMRVTLLVDALGPEPGGIGRYTWELSQRLPQQPGFRQVRYVAGSRFFDDPSILIERGKLPRLGRFRRLWNRWAVARELRSSLVHSPNYFLPDDVGLGLITVHDLSVMKYPETHPAERVRQFERKLPASIEKAAHIITDTETVRREVQQSFGVDANMVTAIPLGVDERFRPRSRDELAPVLQQFALPPGGYAICVSTIEPRKRIAELLEAWDGLPDGLREAVPLVLVGGGGWLADELHRKIAIGQAQGWLRHWGYVPDEQLPDLYAGAMLAVYPSIYEGFGLPPLEAMASGVPVVVANRSCLPEVCGDAARYIDPDDVPRMRDDIAEALCDPGWRSLAIQRGLLRAKHFSWDTCVERTAALYRACS